MAKKLIIKDSASARGAIKMTLTNFEDYRKEVVGVTQRFLERAGRWILEEAKDRVPIDTTALRESGRMSVSKTKTGKLRVSVSFGGRTPITGPNSPSGFVDYAMRIHEDLDMQHQVGEAKYLENAVSFVRPKIEAEMKKMRPKVRAK